MRNLDFSSWPALLSTLLGLALITLIGVGIRLLAMYTIQQRRERENRQINERLRTLIAAYKVLGGSFTGELAVDPTHRRELRQRGEAAGDAAAAVGGERRRRMRDAVEAALSDILLLGTEAQVRLAAQAATELVAGRPIHTAALVVSLRDFIRQVLDLDPVPADLPVPRQGPARPGAAGARGKGEGGDGGARGRSGSGALGLGMGLGLGGAAPDADDAPSR
ncbi:MAG: hypothetical protein U1F22_13530 [Lysobacterales bacterium]